MKKLLSFLALALCFVACQNESVEVVSNGDLADVVLTIDAPELGVTRADGDFMEDGTTPKNAKNSAYGAIDFFDVADWDTYDLRYILEVYAENEDGTGTPIYRERMVNCLDKYAPTTFALRLVPNRTYKFVVFADFVAEGNAELTEPADKLAIEDLYYNTADLRNVTAITTTVNPDTKVAKWGAMNEARDAYFVTENVEINNSLTKDLTLTRPFAKLRVIATDLDYIAGYSKPGYVEVAYHTEKVFKSFNAVNGNLNAAEMTGNELAYGFEVKKDEPYTAGYDEFSTNQTLFTDYLLAVEGEQTTVNFSIAVYEDANKTRKIHEHNFNTQIPIQRNHLTTLIGDILTTQANIEIKIDDNFADEFVIGVGDDNTTTINSWGAGQLNANGDYTFVVTGENDFEVTVNGASVVSQKLATGDYVLAEDAEKDENGNIVAGQKTFTVKSLQANETTRALVDVEVIGGKMNVQAVDDNYKITLDLVLQFAEEKDVRHAIYTYEGTIAFGKVLDTPKVEATVKGNVVTLTWDAVADATKYTITITGITDEPVVTTETTYEFTGEYETEYTYSVVASNDTLNSQPYNGTVKTEAEPVVEPEEPTDLATPVVNASVKGNVVTLTWATVENAGSYKVFIGNEADGISETVTPEEGATEVTFVKEGLDYSTEYTFTVYAIPADTEQYATSKAVVVVETEAEVEVPAEGAKLTVEEFINLANTDIAYELTGEITNITNTTYGNFYLTDSTGTIYVYGLDNWNDYGFRVGDTITIKGKYLYYEKNNVHEVVEAVYISHVAAPYIEATPATVEASAVEATINVSANVAWTVTCDAEATWVTSYTQSGENSGTISVEMEANEAKESRTATFTLSSEGLEPVTVTLTQGANLSADDIADFVITFPGNPSEYTSAYTKTFNITLNDTYVFEFNNINNGQAKDNWNAIRMGRKSDATVATIITKNAVPYAVSAVKVNFTQIGSHLNSAQLVVASDADFTNIVETVDGAPAVGEVVYEVANPADGYFYKLVYDIDVDGSNGNYRIDKITYSR